MADKKEKKTENKKVKKVKAEKKVPGKKLPKLLKKNYTKDELNKKLLKKIYIDADKKLVSSIFEPAKDKKGRDVLCVDKTKDFSKKDFLKLKQISKDVNAQKAGFKLIPFLAVCGFLCAVGITVTMFKNVVLKIGITSSMQSVFNAKTDIQKVDLQIFAASLEIDGLEQASEDSPMTNLFQIDKIAVKFNLTDLLKGKIHIENLEASGVAIGTDRKTSGALAAKKVSKEEKKETEKVEKASKESSLNAKNQLAEMFAGYNPETMLSNLQNELSSPVVAKQISDEVTQKITKWQNVPAEYKEQVERLTANVNKIIKTDYSKLSDPVKLKSALETINSVMKDNESLQKKLSSTAKDIKTDSQAVTQYSAKLTDAIKKDTQLVDKKINEMKASFSPEGLKKIMSDAVTSILYQYTGKYYPLVKKGMDAALSAKGSSEDKSKEKKAKKTKKSTVIARSAGRNVYYKKDTVPKLLIENVKASGYEYKTNELLFTGTAKDISSDQNMYGKPCTINSDFKVTGKKNTAKIVIDARESSKEPLVTCDYSGKGYPMSADAQVFALKSNADIDARLKAKDDGSFVVGGTLKMKVSEMNGMDFEPARVSSLYKKAMKNVTNLTIGFDAGYDVEEGIKVNITNLDTVANQLVSPVSKALTAELNVIAQDAKSNVTKVLNEKTGGAASKITEFNGISNSLNKQLTSVNSLNSQLEKKKSEISKQLTNGAADQAADAAKKALKSLF